MTKVLLILVSILLVILVAGVGFYSSKNKELQLVKQNISTLEINNFNLTKTLEDERVRVKEADERAKNYLAAKEVIENEAKANRDCIANRTCGIELRWKKAICSDSRMPPPTSGESGTDESTFTNQRNFESWVVDLQESIDDNLIQIKGLQEELVVRSDINYCNKTR